MPYAHIDQILCGVFVIGRDEEAAVRRDAEIVGIVAFDIAVQHAVADHVSVRMRAVEVAVDRKNCVVVGGGDRCLCGDVPPVGILCKRRFQILRRAELNVRDIYLGFINFVFADSDADVFILIMCCIVQILRCRRLGLRRLGFLRLCFGGGLLRILLCLFCFRRFRVLRGISACGRLCCGFVLLCRRSFGFLAGVLRSGCFRGAAGSGDRGCGSVYGIGCAGVQGRAVCGRCGSRLLRSIAAVFFLRGFIRKQGEIHLIGVGLRAFCKHERIQQDISGEAGQKRAVYGGNFSAVQFRTPSFQKL